MDGITIDTTTTTTAAVPYDEDGDIEAAEALRLTIRQICAALSPSDAIYALREEYALALAKHYTLAEIEQELALARDFTYDNIAG